MAQDKEIPRYDKGSLASRLLDFGIGFIIILFHSEGMIPVSKQTLKRTCKNEILHSFLKISVGIPSFPHAFPYLAFLTAFSTSKLDIFSLMT